MGGTKFYRLTQKGRVHLNAQAASWRRSLEAVNLILSLAEEKCPMTWWSRLWRRNKLEQDLGRELQFHIDEISALRALE